jgi:hypothetical protein
LPASLIIGYLLPVAVIGLIPLYHRIDNCGGHLLHFSLPQPISHPIYSIKEVFLTFMANLPKRLGYARIDRVSVVIQSAWGMLPIVVVPGHRNPYGSSLAGAGRPQGLCKHPIPQRAEGYFIAEDMASSARMISSKEKSGGPYLWKLAAILY